MKNVTYINAGAGSGKTFRLTKTLTELIQNGQVKPDQVILTTFTTKAANEFKEKAKAFLFEKGMYEEAMQLDHAMIGTVHSVCQRMIGKYWFNLGLSPKMDVMAEEDIAYYRSQSLAELPTEEELKELHEFAREFEIGEKNAYGGTSSTKIDYNFWQGQLDQIIIYATNYEIENFARCKNESLDFIIQFVRNGSSISVSDSELDRMLQEGRTHVQNNNRIKNKDKYYNDFDDIKKTSWNKSLGWYKKVANAFKANFGNTCAEVAERLSGLWVSKEVYYKQERYIALLFELAQRWKENYAQFKRDKNLLDYNDMEKYMRLLMQNESIASEIGKSYRYLFVDEFQDSSPIQVKIFDALSDLMEHSYWVGDYKQAIYGFRGSDIALTKAVVDRVSKKEDGCDTDTLDKSYRSLPDIVDVNNAVFEKTFAEVLEEKNIHLDQVRKNEKNEKSLRYFVSQEDLGVAEHVLKLLMMKAKPNEIAVLARRNETLATISEQLKAWNIPSSRENSPVAETGVYTLVVSLMRIVSSCKDSLAKATVAYLTEGEYSTKKIIEEKILNDADADAKAEDYLAEVPLIKQLMTIRPRLQQQSVASLVESLIIELNLYDVMKKVEADPIFGTSCLQTIISTARTYEQHCVQMNLPATIDGFIAYFEEIAPTCSGDPNGVQLHTYHSCKGLQWKYVILTSLNANVADVKKSLRNETYGVHVAHEVEPTAENPYPEVYIRVTPWIFGSARTIPSEISDKIEESAGFQIAYNAMLAENNRLFYVGMTRARDVLLLSIENKGKLLQWPKDIGMDTVSPEVPDEGDWDVFGTGHAFNDYTWTQEQLEDIAPYGEEDETMHMQLNINTPSFEKSEPRYLSPSRIHGMGDVESHHNFEERIPLAKQPESMAVVGDCIHQIFAAIEEKRPAYKIEMDEVIGRYGLKDVLVDKEAITRAWTNLVEYLTAKHGTPVKTYHERPFRLERDGQTIVGSMDLVWQTAEGDILVDFKTCPMGPKAVLDSESEHYVGLYAGQLDAYQDALEAAGETVVKRYVYYPVSGLLVGLTRAINIDPPYKKSMFHIFGIDGLELDNLWDVATKYCSDDGFSGKIFYNETEDNNDTVMEYRTVLQGSSTQGVIVTYYAGKQSHLHIDLPWLGSVGDIKLTYAFMLALREMYPECEIYYNDTFDKGQFTLNEDNYNNLVTMMAVNMISLIESSKNGQHAGAPGIFHDFIVPSLEDYPDMSVEDLALKAIDDFVSLQWKYADYENAGLANARSPYGEEFTLRILTNSSNTFVGVCQHVAVSNNKDDVKDVVTRDFVKAMEGNPYFRMVDELQFVLDKMPEDEWQKMYDSLVGQEMQGASDHKPNTFLLRWNPGISSYKLDRYVEDLKNFPEGFMSNWSVYEWEEAHNGDRYYMLRVGEGNTGIVYHGEFLSEPYEGDDWAGQGKKRRYVDISCFDATAPDEKPIMTTEELKAAIPDIDWDRGHSGQLLTDEQADAISQMISKKL